MVMNPRLLVLYSIDIGLKYENWRLLLLVLVLFFKVVQNVLKQYAYMFS